MYNGEPGLKPGWGNIDELSHSYGKGNREQYWMAHLEDKMTRSDVMAGVISMTPQ